MIGFDVKIEKNPDLQRSLDEQTRELMIKQGRELAGDIKASLIKRNRPSFPGETPTVSGEKLKDIVVTYDAQNKAVLVYPRPFGNRDVPADLEFGKGAMKPRPYLRPAFERNISKIINGWRNAIK